MSDYTPEQIARAIEVAKPWRDLGPASHHVATQAALAAIADTTERAASIPKGIILAKAGKAAPTESPGNWMLRGYRTALRKGEHLK